MAEAIFNSLAGENLAISAGVKVNENEGAPLPEFVLQSMREIGINLSQKTRKQINQSEADNSDLIIVMAEEKDMPEWLLNSHKVIFWDIPDASGQSLDFHRATRDAIKQKVEKLLEK